MFKKQIKIIKIVLEDETTFKSRIGLWLCIQSYTLDYFPEFILWRMYHHGCNLMEDSFSD
jgi:hypothetical protein